MTISLRPLAVAAVLLSTAGAAAGQTVIVRRAPIGSTIEVVVNTTKAGSAQADAGGDARVPFTLPSQAANNEMDARVYVDTCDVNHRVTITDANSSPLPPETDCTRQEIIGVFLIRQISTVVINVGDPVATLLLRQGSYSLRPRGPRRQAPRGLIVFAGGSLLTYANAIKFGCVDVPTCSGDERGIGYTVGADFWVSRYIGIEGSYLRPPHLTIAGSGTAYKFDSFLKPHLFIVAGKVGVPAGPVRFYGRAGFNYHRADSGTTQVIDPITTTVGDVTTTTPGSTSTVEAKTDGWGWVLSGGMEAWLAPAFALYIDGGGASIKGKSKVVAQGTIDNRLTVFTAGIRIKLGR